MPQPCMFSDWEDPRFGGLACGLPSSKIGDEQLPLGLPENCPVKKRSSGALHFCRHSACQRHVERARSTLFFVPGLGTPCPQWHCCRYAGPNLGKRWKGMENRSPCPGPPFLPLQGPFWAGLTCNLMWPYTFVEAGVDFLYGHLRRWMEVPPEEH